MDNWHMFSLLSANIFLASAIVAGKNSDGIIAMVLCVLYFIFFVVIS